MVLELRVCNQRALGFVSEFMILELRVCGLGFWAFELMVLEFTVCGLLVGF